jgi:nitronate monooxygenase
MADRVLIDEHTASLRLPVIVAPMFLISGLDMVIAAGQAGLAGAFPERTTRTLADLEIWLQPEDSLQRQTRPRRCLALTVIGFLRRDRRVPRRKSSPRRVV